MNTNSVIGRQFGFLTVLRTEPKTRRLVCRCICGNEKSYNRGSIYGKGTKSCGCMRIEGTRSKRKRLNKFHGVNRRMVGIDSWIAQIQLKGNTYHLGEFKNELEAAKAVDKKAIEILGHPLNFTDEHEHEGEAVEILTIIPGEWRTS